MFLRCACGLRCISVQSRKYNSWVVVLCSSALTLLLYSCGGSGGGSTTTGNDIAGIVDDAAQEGYGTFEVDPFTGRSVYTSESLELKPGLFVSRLVTVENAIAADGTGVATVFRGLVFENTTSEEMSFSFVENIPKTMAASVDDLQVKMSVLPAGGSIVETLSNSADYFPIDHWEADGSIVVLEDDPVLLIAQWGLRLIAGGLAVVVGFQNGLPLVTELKPIETASNVESVKSKGKLADWMESRLGNYCEAIQQSAERNNIPPRLLAGVIFNELADYDWMDQLQEVTYTGTDKSHGWPQLQPQRLRDHELIKIGFGEDLDPDIDIPLDELLASISHISTDRMSAVLAESGLSVDSTPQTIDEADVDIDTVLADRELVGSLIWQRLVNGKASIELAAREIAWLLDRLAPGSQAARNPFAASLLKDPAKGIDRDSPFDNLRVDPKSNVDSGTHSRERQIELERTLLLLIVAGYNGGGAIYNRTQYGDVFQNEPDPWGAEPLGPSGIPRRHANNAAVIFPDALYDSWCLRETDNGTGNSDDNGSDSNAFAQGFHVVKEAGSGWRKRWGGYAHFISGHGFFPVKFSDEVTEPVWQYRYWEFPLDHNLGDTFAEWKSDAEERSRKACDDSPPICPCDFPPDIWISGPEYSVASSEVYNTLEELEADFADPSITNLEPGSSRQWEYDTERRIEEALVACGDL